MENIVSFTLIRSPPQGGFSVLPELVVSLFLLFWSVVFLILSLK